MNLLPSWIQRRFALVYMALGIVVAAIGYADVKAITYRAPSTSSVRATAVQAADSQLKAALGNQDVVVICEKDIAAAIAANSGTVLGFKDASTKLQSDGTVRVVVSVNASAPFGGPSHCVLNKGIYQATEVGPGA